METSALAPRAGGRKPHVVILGGGFAGLSAARALRRAPVSVTLVDRRNYHLFQPLLYQVATAALAPESIAHPLREAVGPQVDVVLANVAAIDIAQRSLRLENRRTVPYDYLIIATGAEPHFFGHDDWEQHSYTMKSIESAERLRNRIVAALEAADQLVDGEARRRLLTFVVVGGGPTGVELSGAISELSRLAMARQFQRVRAEDIRVILIEMLDRLLVAFAPELSAKAQAQLESLNVDVRLSTKVIAVTDAGIQTDVERIPAATVCWASGIQPSRLPGQMGLETNRKGGVIVDRDCSVPGHPEVFAIGDVASFAPPGADKPLPQLASVAMQQGRFVAQAIRRELVGEARGSFTYKDRGMMATIGRSRAVAQTDRLKLSGFVAWLAWILVHVYFLIGFRNRVLVLVEWFWYYVTWRRPAQPITSEDVARETAQAKCDLVPPFDLEDEAQDCPPPP